MIKKRFCRSDNFPMKSSLIMFINSVTLFNSRQRHGETVINIFRIFLCSQSALYSLHWFAKMLHSIKWCMKTDVEMKGKDPFLPRDIKKLEIRISRWVILEFNKFDFFHGTLGVISILSHNFGKNARSYFTDMKAEKTWNNKGRSSSKLFRELFKFMKCINIVSELRHLKTKSPQPQSLRILGWWMRPE